MIDRSADPAASASYTHEPDFKLGEWWIRPQRNELDRTGESAHVEARSMGVLVCLARHAPRVVSKQRLLDEVWSDSPYVGEEVISHAIWELRKVLGDSAREPAYIKTVPRKGYVLLAEVVRPRGSPLPVEGARIDHYDIREELGRGSMGVVFKAFDRRLERTVAIKFLAPELTRDHDACRRFQREAQLAAALDHPNLATVHAIGETSEGQHYLVTPFYAGGSLKERCARGTLTPDQAVRFAEQLARGLAAAHAQGIVHRDIKPANLLIDEHGTLKIADFGIAKLLGATDLTRTGVSLGTPAYKSPEQARGRDVDHRTDIWSFGVVLFEMLTGRRPFDGEYEQAVIHSILTLDPVAETDARGEPVPERLRRVVAKAMAREPGERYQRAEEVVGELEGLDDPAARAAAIRSRLRAVWPNATAWLTPRRAALAAALVLVLVLVLVVAGYGVPRALSRLPSEAPDATRRALTQITINWTRGNDRKNLGEVREQVEALLAESPDRPEVRAFAALFLADAFSRDPNARRDAARLAKGARDLDPRLSLPWSAEARLALSEGGFEAARQAAHRAIEIEPSCGHGENCDLAYIWRSDADWMLEREEEAMDGVSSCLAEGSGHIRCRLKRAQLFELSGEPGLAREDYEEVLRSDPTQTTALNELGILYMGDGRFQDAADLFLRRYQRTDDPASLFNHSLALMGLERWLEAIELLEEVLSLYMAHGIQSAEPADALGDVYTELGRPDRADEYYRMALRTFEELLAGPNPTVDNRAHRAVCLAKLGRFAEAESEIQALLARDGSYPHLVECAARIAALAGDRELLYQRTQRAIAEGVSPVSLETDVSFRRFRNDARFLEILAGRLDQD